MTDTAYYPPPAFAFSVAILPGASSPSQTTIDAAFQEVSGIDPKVEIVEEAEGGVNNYVHQLPGVTKHSNLVLKRGYVTQTSSLATWAEQTVGSTLGAPIQTQVITVMLLGPDQQPLVTWTFDNAWPVKWEASGFDSTKNDVLTETLEISYTTVTRTLNQSSSTTS
ncbi:MAG: phage tail protein [Pseudomonadota bacterium]